MWFTYIIPPVVGAVIGYFTNEIAIRMLFRPHYPKYLFGWKIPFTPGLIPKEKSRIASSVAEAVAVNLMNKETMEKNLLSDEMITKIDTGIQSFIDKQKDNEETLKQYITHYFTETQVDEVSSRAVQGFSKQISAQVVNVEVANHIATKVVEYVIERLDHGVWGLIGADKLVGCMSDSLEKKLTKHVSTVLQENGPEIIDNIVKNQSEAILNKRMCDMFSNKEEEALRAKALIISAYRSIISDYLPRLLDTIDIQNIVEGRLNDMDVEEMETLILQVMKKELRAIVWLGALLGGILGLINLFVMI